jgi:S1-C subfamily serine protease
MHFTAVRRPLFIFSLLLMPQTVRAQDDASYRRAVDSVVMVAAFDKDWEISYGTGVVIDAAKGHVLTAYHVIGTDRVVAVIMPVRRDGEIVTDPAAYTNALKCMVVARDAKRDLALLQIKPPLPPLTALPLAAKSASPGAAVFTIGGDAAKSLWRFSAGHVRQIYADSWTFASGQEVSARVVEMTVAINPGDSGGAIINQANEVVGINSATKKDASLTSKGIDVTEVKAFLSEHPIR